MSSNPKGAPQMPESTTELPAPEGCAASAGFVCLDVTPDFKAGDPQPDGYIARQEWAAVQMKAGLKQEQCGWCCRWKFPFEMSDHVESMKCMTSRGDPHLLMWKLCLACHSKRLSQNA